MFNHFVELDFKSCIFRSHERIPPQLLTNYLRVVTILWKEIARVYIYTYIYTYIYIYIYVYIYVCIYIYIYNIYKYKRQKSTNDIDSWILLIYFEESNMELK